MATADQEIRLHPESFTQREGVKAQIAERGKRDLYYLASVILGYDRLRPQTHGPFCRFHDTCNLPRRLALMPRSHFKSSIWTIGGTIQDIINNPDERILLAASTHDNASRFLEEIKRHFTLNNLFQWAYPDVCWDDPKQSPRWNRMEMEVPRSTFVREPTVDTIGSRGEVVSRHYTKIVLDDIIGEQEYQSEAEMRKTCEWVAGLESLLVPPFHKRQIDTVGTRWSLDDVYAFVEFLFGGGKGTTKLHIGPYAICLGGKLGIFSRPAIENEVPIFPEEFTLETFENIRRGDPERYAAQYVNDPLSSGVSEFQLGWLNNWRVGEKGLLLLDGVTKPFEWDSPTYILCDPAYTKNRKNCRSAIVVVSVCMWNAPNLVMREAFLDHIEPDGLVKKLFETYDKYPWASVVSLEANANQKVLGPYISHVEATERRDKPMLPIVEYKPRSAKDGVTRIRGLQPICRSGQLFVPDKGVSEWIDEYERWHPKARWQDGMDAMAQILDYVDFGLTKATESAYEEFNRLMAASRDVLTGV